MIESSIIALVYCLTLIVQEAHIALKSNEKCNYEEIKYLLNAIQEATQGLGSVSTHSSH
jgi:hypothetical protein